LASAAQIALPEVWPLGWTISPEHLAQNVGDYWCWSTTNTRSWSMKVSAEWLCVRWRMPWPSHE